MPAASSTEEAPPGCSSDPTARGLTVVWGASSVMSRTGLQVRGAIIHLALDDEPARLVVVVFLHLLFARQRAPAVGGQTAESVVSVIVKGSLKGTSDGKLKSSSLAAGKKRISSYEQLRARVEGE